MKEVDVKCPFCETENKINIPDEILLQKKFGIFKIEVPVGAACNNHRFIVFVDTNGNVRGYERIDVLMEHAPVQERNSNKDIGNITLDSIIKLVGFDCTTLLMHAKIHNYPMILVHDKDSEDMTRVLNLVGNNILPREYRESGTTIIPIKKNEFNIQNHKNAFIMDENQNIIQIPWTLKVKFEEEIIKKALEIFNPTEQVKLLQRDIKSFIRKAESVKAILDENPDISNKELIKLVSRDFRIPKLSKNEIVSINEFIDQRLK